MPNAQNKTVRLYGPWKGQDDSGTRTSAVEFERCFNVEFEGEEAVTRNGRVRFLTGGALAVTALGEIGNSLVAARYYAGLGARLAVPTGVSTWTAVVLPYESVSTSDKWESFAYWNGSIVLTGGYGSPLVYNGATCSVIAAVPGQDSATTGYLSALPAAKFATKYHGRMFLVTRSGTVVFSESEGAINIIPVDGSAPFGALNVWPASNNFDARVSATDEARGCVVFGDQLVLPTRDGLFVYDEYALRRIPGAPGCAAPGSIAETPKGLVYLAADGLYVFNGSGAERLSDRLQDTLSSYVRFNHVGAVGYHYPRRAQYHLSLPVSGGTHNSLRVVWNYRENRWTTHGGTPYWMATNAAFQEMEVASALVQGAGTEDETLITGDYSGNLWQEDIGLSDDGKRIVSHLVFARVGSGEDAGVRTYRDMFVEARATGAALKVALLPDGEDFLSGKGSDAELFNTAPGIITLLPGQTTWGSNASPIYRTTASFAQGPVSIWQAWRSPQRAVARSVQPVVWCDGTDRAGLSRGGRMAVRGIEIQYRPRAGARGAA